MAASGIAVEFEWTPFSHGFVFWEYPGPEHLPPSDAVGQREWLEGFLQAHADYPDEPYDPDNPDSGETAADALQRMLPGNPHLLALLEFGHKRLQLDTERATERLEFEHVDPPIAPLALPDERLRGFKRPRKLDLGETGILPFLAQESQ